MDLFDEFCNDQRILVVAAHPDDEVLGRATLAKASEQVIKFLLSSWVKEFQRDFRLENMIMKIPFSDG